MGGPHVFCQGPLLRVEAEASDDARDLSSFTPHLPPSQPKVFAHHTFFSSGGKHFWALLHPLGERREPPCLPSPRKIKCSKEAIFTAQKKERACREGRGA